MSKLSDYILDRQLNAMRLNGKRGGADRAASSGGDRAIAVFNPFTGQAIGAVPKATLEEVKATLAQAQACKPNLSRFERAAILNRAAAINASS